MPVKEPTHAQRRDEGGQQREDNELSLDTIEADSVKYV
jgi:hypothetical protein